TSRTIWAPMFSNLSSSSISLATVTPSLVIRGAPNDLSSTTLRPFGPSVTLTALARMSAPRSIFSRASVENLTSLAAMMFLSMVLVGPAGSGGLLADRTAFENAHHVGFLHDQVFLTVDLDLGAGPLAEQDAVAGLDVERDELAGFVAGAGADGDDFAFLGLLLGGIRNDDAAGGPLIGVDPANEDAVMQWAEFHEVFLLCWWAKKGWADAL